MIDPPRRASTGASVVVVVVVVVEVVVVVVRLVVVGLGVVVVVVVVVVLGTGSSVVVRDPSVAATSSPSTVDASKVCSVVRSRLRFSFCRITYKSNAAFSMVDVVVSTA